MLHGTRLGWLGIRGKVSMKAGLSRWLQAPPVTGWCALAGAIAAVAVPTMLRFAVRGSVTGCEFTPYLPFILIAAILLGWWQAAGVALASVAVLGGLFVGPQAAMAQRDCFESGAAVFLASSAVVVGVAVVVRRLIGNLQRRGTDEGSGGIVFSVEQGEVWASWYGQDLPLRLGPQRKVARMMKEFLAGAQAAKGAAQSD
jgi:hypothetical protein